MNTSHRGTLRRGGRGGVAVSVVAFGLSAIAVGILSSCSDGAGPREPLKGSITGTVTVADTALPPGIARTLAFSFASSHVSAPHDAPAAAIVGVGPDPPAQTARASGPTGRLVVTFRNGSAGLPAIPGPALSVAQAHELRRSIETSLGHSPAAPSFTLTGISPALRAARVEVSDPSRVEAVRAVLLTHPGVASVQPEVWLHQDDQSSPLPRAARANGPTSVTSAGSTSSGRRVPNDQLWAAQAWHYGMVDLPRAWRHTTGSRDVIVAVLDSGIRFDHPDLAANLTSDGYDFVSRVTASVCGMPMDNSGDGDGYDPDPTQPMDYDCRNGEPSRAGGHGVHVAGTVGAVGNNGVGVTGVNWNVRIRPMRVLGVGRSTTDYDVAQAILYASALPADDGAGGTVRAPSRADVLTMSFSGPFGSALLEEAVRAADGAGVLLIASAGNLGSSSPVFPAAYPEVISVAAVGAFGTPASYSNFGPWVDISAPGGDWLDPSISYRVASTAWDFAASEPAYAYNYGTSMAAPHVAGVAALLLAHEPSLSAAQLRTRLLDFAVGPGAPGYDSRYGAGIVNARNSLTTTHAPERDLYVRLHDARTGAPVRMVAAIGGVYSFADVPEGEYFVVAGFDEAGDERIGFPGRVWGFHAAGGDFAPVSVRGTGNHVANFTVGYPLESEPNDTRETANPLVIGGYVHGHANAEDDVDYFRVTVPAGQYTFETSGWGDTACGYAHALNTVLEVQRADGTSIATSVDIDTARLNYCSRITATLEAGTYFLRVAGSGGPRYRLEARSGP